MTTQAYEGTDTIVLYEELAYEDVLPLAWRRLPEPFDPTVIGSFADRNLRVLQSLSALEEHGQIEKPDENAPHAADILRLDMKMNLLLDMVGQLLLASRPRPRATAIRFNALGAVWQGLAPHPELGNQGVLEIFLRDCIAEPLRLVGKDCCGFAGRSHQGEIHSPWRERRGPDGEACLPSASTSDCRRQASEKILTLRCEVVCSTCQSCAILRKPVCSARDKCAFLSRFSVEISAFH